MISWYERKGFFSKIKVEALSMVCESRYKKWYHTINLEHYPAPLLQANLEFSKLPSWFKK